jgi:hypothetical protein
MDKPTASHTTRPSQVEPRHADKSAPRRSIGRRKFVTAGSSRPRLQRVASLRIEDHSSERLKWWSPQSSSIPSGAVVFPKAKNLRKITLNPCLAAKILSGEDEPARGFGIIYCPGGATEFSPGFQPGFHPGVSTLGTATQATRPERAPDQTYRKQSRRAFLEPAIAVLVRIILAHGRLLSLPNKCPIPF